MKALVIVAACCTAPLPAIAAPGLPKVALSRPLPTLVRVGQHVTITGRVPRSPARASAALQLRPIGGRWRTLARRAIGARHRFTIRWHVTGPEGRPISLRVATLKNGRLLAHTPARQSAIGPKAVYCAPPVPPAVDIPVGSGWIVGGVYLEGGPFPGIFQCEQQPYTINVETSSGTIVASQHVAAGHSYTVVVPAGSYKLHANTGCFGSATVTAAHQTKANAVCPVP